MRAGELVMELCLVVSTSPLCVCLCVWWAGGLVMEHKTVLQKNKISTASLIIVIIKTNFYLSNINFFFLTPLE